MLPTWRYGSAFEDLIGTSLTGQVNGDAVTVDNQFDERISTHWVRRRGGRRLVVVRAW